MRQSKIPSSYCNQLKVQDFQKMHGSFHQFLIWVLEVPVTLALTTQVTNVSPLPLGPTHVQIYNKNCHLAKGTWETHNALVYSNYDILLTGILKPLLSSSGTFSWFQFFYLKGDTYSMFFLALDLPFQRFFSVLIAFEINDRNCALLVGLYSFCNPSLSWASLGAPKYL